MLMYTKRAARLVHAGGHDLCMTKVVALWLHSIVAGRPSRVPVAVLVCAGAAREEPLQPSFSLVPPHAMLKPA